MASLILISYYPTSINRSRCSVKKPLQKTALPDILTLMSFYLVEILGKQYRVDPGVSFTVVGDLGADGSVYQDAKVVLASLDGQTEPEIGQPYLDITLNLQVLSHTLGEKIRVSTYKSKSRYRKTQGHRDHLTVLVLSAEKAKVAKKPAKSKKSA